MIAIAKNNIETELYFIKKGTECTITRDMKITFQGLWVCDLGSDFQQWNFELVSKL